MWLMMQQRMKVQRRTKNSLVATAKEKKAIEFYSL